MRALTIMLALGLIALSQGRPEPQSWTAWTTTENRQGNRVYTRRLINRDGGPGINQPQRYGRQGGEWQGGAIQGGRGQGGRRPAGVNQGGVRQGGAGQGRNRQGGRRQGIRVQGARSQGAMGQGGFMSEGNVRQGGVRGGMAQGGEGQGRLGQGEFGQQEFDLEGSGLGGKLYPDKKLFPCFLDTGEQEHCLKVNVKTKCERGAGPIFINHSK